jgi:hypothetical protein
LKYVLFPLNTTFSLIFILLKFHHHPKKRNASDPSHFVPCRWAISEKFIVARSVKKFSHSSLSWNSIVHSGLQDAATGRYIKLAESTPQPNILPILMLPFHLRVSFQCGFLFSVLAVYSETKFVIKNLYLLRYYGIRFEELFFIQSRTTKQMHLTTDLGIMCN